MRLQASELDIDSIYKLLSGIVVPRPIAWITTLSQTGVVNLAPFSCYTFVSSKPPMLGVSMGSRAGKRKDTAINVMAGRDFVVNIGDMSQIEQIHLSSAEHPPEVSEVELLGLATSPSTLVRTPRLADAPISMECVLRQVVPFGEGGSEFVVGEVLCFHVRDSLWRNGKIDTRELNPVCRLGGPNYAVLGELLTLQTVPLTPRGAVSGG